MKKFLLGLVGVVCALFAVPAHALPAGYTALEYIENTGTQYLDLQTGTQTGVFRIVSDIYAEDSSAWQYLMGYAKDNSGVPLSLWVAANKIKDTFTSGTGNVIADVNKWEHIDVTNSNTVTISDFYIFHVNKSVDSYSGNPGKIKYLSLYKDGVLIRNMVPAKNSSGVIGMYDTVGGQFYTNAGTGSFVAGPIACDGERVAYTSATGTVVQNGTPTPTNPIYPTFYTQGNMVLRAVESDENLVADSYDASTGKITRRVGIKVLDGTEDWEITAGTVAENSYFYLSFNISVPESFGSSSVISTHFPSILIGYANNNQGITVARRGATGYQGAYIRWNDLYVASSTTINSFKQWLAQQYAAGTPVTIYYTLATPVEEDWTETSYCSAPIKVASTKYVETQFSDLGTRLAAAVATVNTVVTNTINQAASIATLQSGKQTRPNDIADNNEKCPAYKQCLLVEDENGTPHWYQITDPFRDFVAPIVTNNVAPASTTNQPGYTQLEYIDMPASTYLLTNVIPTYNGHYELDFQTVNIYNGSAILGGRSSGYPGGIVFSNSEFKVLFDAFSSTRHQTDYTIVNNARYKYVFNNQVVTLYRDNVIGVTYTFDGTDANGGQLCINGINNAGNVIGNTGNIDVYSFKAWNAQGILVANFIPAKRNSDGAIGMYDTVTKTFFTNAGSGTFTAGPTVANTDVPANPTWSATWAANASNGVTAGTVYGEGLCNAVTGTASTAATSAQTSSANWLVDGANCWCRATAIDDGNESSDVDGVWVFAYTFSLAADCANACAYRCAYRVRDNASFRSAVFGM